MSQAQQYNSPQIEDDEIDLAELWRAIWAGKFIIIAITFVFAVASVFYALSKPDVYKASVLLSPVSSQGGSGGLGALAGQFGGLASIAGINLAGTSDNKTILALATIESRYFLEDFINKNKLIIPLIAANGWDKDTNKLFLDKKIYNDKWLIPSSESTAWKAYKRLLERLSISQDKNTSLVTISLEFYSPNLAKKWLSLLINEVNLYIKEQNKKETEKTINYLKEKIKTIENKNMETVFYQLIEEQSKNLMLAQVKKEYVFRTVDPAQVPEVRDTPKRLLIIIIGCIVGFLISIFFICTRHFLKK